VLLRHDAAQRAVPIVTVIGIGIAVLIGGVVVTESVYGIPGSAVSPWTPCWRATTPPCRPVILVFSVVYVLINLLVDLSYTVLDPESATDGAAAQSQRAAGRAILGVVVAVGLLAPVLATSDPSVIDPAARNRKPGAERTVRGDDGRPRASATGWAPTASAATSTAASSTARASRSWSV